MPRRRPRRLPLRVAAIGAIGAVAVLACGFPDATFRSADVDGAAEGSTPPPIPAEAGIDAGEGGRLPPDVDPNFNPDASLDAMTRDDSGVVRPDGGVDAAVGCSAAPGGSACNCDGDDAGNNGPGCELTGATDCDDFDDLVFPGQEFVIADWDPRSPHTPAQDWNCDGTVTKQMPYDVKCAVVGADCTQGFENDVPCGQSGKYNFCQALLPLPGLPLVCSVKSSETRTQACK